MLRKMFYYEKLSCSDNAWNILVTENIATDISPSTKFLDLEGGISVSGISLECSSESHT